jgi:hypothetical protein
VDVTTFATMSKDPGAAPLVRTILNAIAEGGGAGGRFSLAEFREHVVKTVRFVNRLPQPIDNVLDLMPSLIQSINFVFAF